MAALTEAQRHLVRQAAVLAITVDRLGAKVRREEAVDADTYTRAANAYQRVLTRLERIAAKSANTRRGIRSRQPSRSLAELLAEKQHGT